MSIMELYYRHRNKARGLMIALAIPAVFLGGLLLALNTGDNKDSMRAAAIALDTYYNENPPNGIWEYQGVRIVDDIRLVVDVHIGVVPQATVIESRNQRIRYSYMKLACPDADRVLDKWTEDKRVWINLNFHGKTLIEAACPRGNQGNFFTS